MANTNLEIKPLSAKNVMLEKDADSPCKKIYFVVQLMYLSDEPHTLHTLFFDLVRNVQKAAPSTSLCLARVCGHILDDDYFGALKETCTLIEYEQALFAKA